MGDQTHGPPPPSPPGSDAAGGGQALPRAGPPDGRAPKVVTVYASSSSGVADAYKKLAYSMGEVRPCGATAMAARLGCLAVTRLPRSALGLVPAFAAASLRVLTPL